MPSIMGIDPGLRGAIAVIDYSGKVCNTWLLADIMEYPSMFEELVTNEDVQHICIEKAQSMPGQGGSSMFNYGVGFGRILGWCEGLTARVPYTLLAPNSWMKDMHKGVVGKDGKTKSLEAVRRLFPNEKLLPGRCKKPHDGLIDALLIAEYGRRNFR